MAPAPAAYDRKAFRPAGPSPGPPLRAAEPRSLRRAQPLQPARNREIGHAFSPRRRALGRVWSPARVVMPPAAAYRAALEPQDANVGTARAGTHVTVTGPYVFDRGHGWMEIHPVWKITPR